MTLDNLKIVTGTDLFKYMKGSDMGGLMRGLKIMYSLHNYSYHYSYLSRRLMTPLQKGRLVIDGDRTAGTRDRGIGGSWFLGIFRPGPLGETLATR